MHAHGSVLTLAGVLLLGLLLGEVIDRAGYGSVVWSLLVGVSLAAVIVGAFTTGAAIILSRQPAYHGQEQVIDAEAETASTLDPTGVVRLNGELWSAISEAGAIAEGTRVRVVGRSGLQLAVVPASVPHVYQPEA
jgi:membrane-bound ClpP family serine protease